MKTTPSKTMILEAALEEANGRAVESDRRLDLAIEVLRFYANPENWKWQETPAGEDEYIPCTHDEGDKAREALEKLEVK